MNLTTARRFVQFGLTVLVIAALVVTNVQWRHRGADLPTPAELTVFVALVIGGVGLLLTWVGWRALRLGDASRAMARWLVTSEEWQRYVAACRMREGMAGAFPGAVTLDLVVPTEGVEVLALPRGFRIGDAFHEVGGLGAEVMDIRVVDAPAPMFEFNVRYSRGRQSSDARGVRIPIAAGAEQLANQVEDYWIAREPLQTMTVAQLRSRERSGWNLTLLGLSGFLGIVALFIWISPPGWAAVGPIAMIGLACYGFGRAIRARAVRFRKEVNAATANGAKR